MMKYSLIALCAGLIVLAGCGSSSQNPSTVSTGDSLVSGDESLINTGNDLVDDSVLSGQQTSDLGSGDNVSESTLYTMDEVALHASADSCRTVISGSVYDQTSFVAQHPGGKGFILQGCGKDSTEEFSKKHAGQENAEAALSTLRIGALAQ